METKLPSLTRPAEDSDDEGGNKDEDYVPSDQEDKESIVEDTEDEAEEEPVTARPGRRVIPNRQYHQFQMLQARG